MLYIPCMNMNKFESFGFSGLCSLVRRKQVEVGTAGLASSDQYLFYLNQGFDSYRHKNRTIFPLSIAHNFAYTLIRNKYHELRCFCYEFQSASLSLDPLKCSSLFMFLFNVAKLSKFGDYIDIYFHQNSLLGTNISLIAFTDNYLFSIVCFCWIWGLVHLQTLKFALCSLGTSFWLTPLWLFFLIFTHQLGFFPRQYVKTFRVNKYIFFRLVIDF